MYQDLKDKVVVVTGGASGIGEAVVRYLVKVGARVWVADANRDLGEALTTELSSREAAGEVSFFEVDVADEDAVMGLIAAVIDRHGALHGAVNCAGLVGTPCQLDEIELKNWQRVIDVNLTGVFLCMKHQLKHMKTQNSGAIVNVSSGAGLVPAPFMSMYTASKHGVLGLTKTAATENIKSGIRVNSVLPGSTRTPMMEATIEGNEALEKLVMSSIPCGRMGTPDEIANGILWLLSDESRYVNGHSLIIDGGTLCR
jgi:NAD(P)-dependent dehydrogenase (short-subunit alcohol dehydrogenase family)